MMSTFSVQGRSRMLAGSLLRPNCPSLQSFRTTKLKPRWNLHSWAIKIGLCDPLKLFHLYLEDGPAPLLDLFPNAHFTLVSAYMNPWFTTTDENP